MQQRDAISGGKGLDRVGPPGGLRYTVLIITLDGTFDDDSGKNDQKHTNNYYDF